MGYGILELAKDAITGDVQVVSDATAEHRYSKCDTCPHLRRNIPDKIILIKKDGERCNLCGCYMPVKVKYAKASCPDDPPQW